MLLFLTQASLILITLLAFYKLFLERESFFTANRCYLLGCLLLAGLLPFIGLPKLVEHQGVVATFFEPTAEFSLAVDLPETDEPVSQRPTSTDAAAERTAQTSPKPLHPTQASTPAISPAEVTGVATERSLADWLLLLYLFGVVVFALNLLAQLIHTLWQVYQSEDKIVDDDGIIVNMRGEVAPCSFFRYIFINPASYDYETYEQIIAHEKIHVERWHTVDLLLAELAIIGLWFNPFVWVLRKEVEKNIEYQTDATLVQRAAEAKESYQLNLVKIACPTQPLAVTTNYNQSLIKKRILKMNAKQSNPYSYWKYAFVAPLLLVLVLFLNKPQLAFAQTDLPETAALSLEEIAAPIPVEQALESSTETQTARLAELAQESEPNQDALLEEEEDRMDAARLADGSCKKLLEAIRAQDLAQVKTLLQTTDANCIDPNPDYEEIKSNGHIWRHEKAKAPLFAAARIGQVAIAKLLVEAGADIKLQVEGDGTPLISAAAYGHLDFVQYLLDQGADVKRYLPNHGNALIAAASNGHTDIAKLFLTKGADIHFHAPNHGTAFIAAANNGHTETAEFLLSKGAELNFHAPNLGTALIAAANNGHTETVKFLLGQNAVLEFHAPNQGTALIAAANNGHIETAKFLLAKGAKLDFHAPNQGTALIAAANNGHTETMKYLLAEGAKLDFHAPNQGTALIAAANNGHTQTMTMLLDAGAQINFHAPNQGTALIAAANNGHTETVKFLLAKGAKLDFHTPNQGTALIAAANNGHVQTVEFLLSKGAAINQVADNQGTALIAAANNGHLQTVKYLINQGADRTITLHGRTALMAAKNNGHVHTTAYLKSLEGR